MLIIMNSFTKYGYNTAADRCPPVVQTNKKSSNHVFGLLRRILVLCHHLGELLRDMHKQFREFLRHFRGLRRLGLLQALDALEGRFVIERSFENIPEIER